MQAYLQLCCRLSDNMIKYKNLYFSYQETPASSNRSSPTVTEEIPSHGDLFATGNTTERSSVDSNYSWDVSTYIG